MADRIYNGIGNYEAREVGGGTVKNDVNELSRSTTEERLRRSNGQNICSCVYTYGRSGVETGGYRNAITIKRGARGVTTTGNRN
jgi:hypothetical protein